MKSETDPNIPIRDRIPIEGYSFKWWQLVKFRQAFTALKYRNYKLWFWGQMISLFGTWMQTTALGFLIYELTQSPTYLGLMGFSMGIPTWIFMMYAGVVADRLPRRNILIATQIVMMILALSLAGLSFSGIIEPWHIIIFAFLFGTINSFDAPARQAFVLEMVEREDLTNAIALNSTLFNSATALGPAVGGIIYAILGPSWCFAINGFSFIAVISSLYRMNLKSFMNNRKENSILVEFKQGIKYVLQDCVTRTIIALVATTTIFGISYTTLIPAWAVNVLQGDVTTNGLLLSARGVGALIGALLIASLGAFKFKGKLLTVGSFMFPALLIIFSFIRIIPISLFVLVGVGTSMMFIFNIANATVQSLVPDNLRGRVMSIYSLSFFGLMPIGSLWIGISAENFGLPTSIILNAMVLLSFSLLILITVPQLRDEE